MAHSANRSIDFAPAWLKLPDQSQQQKRQESQYNNHPNHYNSNSNHRNSIGHSSHHHLTSNHGANSHHAQQQYNFGAHHPNQAAHTYNGNIPPHHQQSHNNGTSHHHYRTSRPSLSSYNSSFNGRTNAPPIQLHRSQSTGSYNETSRSVPVAVNPPSSATPVKPKPLEEEFPVLGNSANPSQANNQVNSTTTAQWRIKERAKEDAKTPAQQPSDNLLTSNMTGGKVYRAQVKPVKRSNMIPITNGTGGITIKTRENGDHNEHHKESSNLSSSLDREKRFLQELGWNENDESDDDCVIPEQDPAELQQIMMQAKAARERLLMKSKQSLKTVPTAILPNEDDIPSSSDNSDVE